MSTSRPRHRRKLRGPSTRASRLAWLSPLPPAAAPAAELTASVLPLVAERFEVVLLTDQERWDPALGERAEVVRAALDEPPWARLNGADMTVFAIGADAASAAIWKVSQHHPGLVVLADEPLLPLFVELGRAEPAIRERLVAHVEETHGALALDELLACLEGAAGVGSLAARVPLTALAARGALAVLAPSRAAAERLAGSPCPVAEAVVPRSPAEVPAPAAADALGSWVETFAALVDSARRFRPLSAVNALARGVADELGLWSGFPAEVERGPLRHAGRAHPLHRRVVGPVEAAVDEVLRQTRERGPTSGD